MRARSMLGFIAAAACVCAGSAVADHPGAGFGHATSGPIITIPASTLQRTRWSVGARVEWAAFDEFTDAELEAYAEAGEDVHSVDQLLSPSLSLGSGITDRLTLGVRFPYVSRTNVREAHLEAGEPELHVHGDSEGFGDATWLGQYRFTSGPETALAAALLAGVKTPTGETDVRTEDGDPFETEHQPGSGSWDFLVGASASKPVAPWSLDANVLATITGENDEGTNLGTLIQYNGAVSWRALPGREHAGHADHVHTSLDFVLELVGESRERQQIDGAEDENSGGTLLYVAPGLRVGRGHRWSGFASAGVPIVQELNGIQHETDLRVIAGVGVSFGGTP